MNLILSIIGALSRGRKQSPTNSFSPQLLRSQFTRISSPLDSSPKEEDDHAPASYFSSCPNKVYSVPHRRLTNLYKAVKRVIRPHVSLSLSLSPFRTRSTRVTHHPSPSRLSLTTALSSSAGGPSAAGLFSPPRKIMTRTAVA